MNITRKNLKRQMKQSIKAENFAYKYAKSIIIVILVFTFIACVVPRKIKGNGCVLLGDEYAVLIKGNRLVWINEIKTKSSKDSIANEKWYQADYMGSYYPFGMYGHLGKFHSKINIDTLKLVQPDSACNEKFTKLW